MQMNTKEFVQLLQQLIYQNNENQQHGTTDLMNMYQQVICYTSMIPMET